MNENATARLPVTICFHIDPIVAAPSLIDKLLEDGTCTECVAYDNGRTFDRDASLLLEDTVLADDFAHELLLDDTSPFIALTVSYPHLNYESATVWIHRLREHYRNMLQEVEVKTPNDEQRQFYWQSLYVALIDRYFDLSGLICYASILRDGIRDFAFEHVATGERILVFSHLDKSVFDIANQMNGKHKIIIDCRTIDSEFSECPDCCGPQAIDCPLFCEGAGLGFLLLKDGSLFGDGNNEDYCGGCWGRLERPCVAGVRFAVLSGLNSARKAISRSANIDEE